MIGTLRRAWTWFVEGLVEATLWIIERTAGNKPWRLEIGDAEALVLAPDGSRLGRLPRSGEPAAWEPADLARRLAGASVDLVIPPAWQFRRDLDPVAVQSRPFLDAFVRHQIERITPWRVEDVHYRIVQKPIGGDATRIAVALAVVPKRLVAHWLAPLESLGPRSVRLRTAGGDAGEMIEVGQDRSGLAGLCRRWIVRGLAVSALGVFALVGALQWQAHLVGDDIAEQDRVLAERKAVLAKVQRRAEPTGDADGKLRHLRESRPTAVTVIDALSSAIPDTAHLTALAIDKDHVTISGISTDPSGLVPALETSGDFADVAFGAATTRVEAGGGDRFGLEMRALVRKGAAPAGPAVGLPPRGAP